MGACKYWREMMIDGARAGFGGAEKGSDQEHRWRD